MCKNFEKVQWAAQILADYQYMGNSVWFVNPPSEVFVNKDLRVCNEQIYSIREGSVSNAAGICLSFEQAIAIAQSLCNNKSTINF